MTDEEYDGLEDELRALDPHHRHFKLVSNLTQLALMPFMD
jgi:hypothetical protein